MAIFDTFSKRLKQKERAGKPDVFQYDKLPQEFCVQVIHIWAHAIPIDAINGYGQPVEFWENIHEQMLRERGVFQLSNTKRHGRVDPFEDCQYFLQEAPTLHKLDLIELSFRVADQNVRSFIRTTPPYRHPKQLPDDAIDELNRRFLEHSIGYEFIGGELIRKDSQFLHAEAVRPAVQLLADGKFHGASEEFLRAHEHYRHGRHEEAMQDALKAFESTLKTICDLRKWPYQPGDAAKALIQVVIQRGLIPAFLSTELPALVTVLESGLPTVRNKLAGHGTGSVPRDVPAHFAAFALHLAASNIVMLVEAHRAKK
jgi:hypothetical protein